VRNFVLALSAAMLMSLSGCGNGTKQDILKKAEGATTKAQLESKLGKPEDFSKLGPVETWTYKASDGEVGFLIVGDTVTVKAAGGDGKK